MHNLCQTFCSFSRASSCFPYRHSIEPEFLNLHRCCHHCLVSVAPVSACSKTRAASQACILDPLKDRSLHDFLVSPHFTAFSSQPPWPRTAITLCNKIRLFEMASHVDQDGYIALPHLELNRDANQTILLIHGATGDGTNWDLVTPHLPGYHLLIPDLPAHGIARQHHFSVAHASDLLRQLILRHAHNGVAYIVGFSLGAHVAIHLVSHYPEMANCVLVSGFQVFPPTALTPYLPYAIWFEQRIEYAVPRSLIRWAMDGVHIPRPDLTKCTVEYYRQVFGSSDEATQWPKPWPARTLIVAAGKGGLVPSNDRPQDARKLASIGQSLNSATRAVTHPDMRHPWIWQAPELFAETVRLWFEGGIVPDGFVSLGNNL